MKAYFYDICEPNEQKERKKNTIKRYFIFETTNL